MASHIWSLQLGIQYLTQAITNGGFSNAQWNRFDYFEQTT